jgi:hypothetical protein
VQFLGFGEEGDDNFAISSTRHRKKKKKKGPQLSIYDQDLYLGRPNISLHQTFSLARASHYPLISRAIDYSGSEKNQMGGA